MYKLLIVILLSNSPNFIYTTPIPINSSIETAINLPIEPLKKAKKPVRAAQKLQEKQKTKKRFDWDEFILFLLGLLVVLLVLALLALLPMGYALALPWMWISGLAFWATIGGFTFYALAGGIYEYWNTTHPELRKDELRPSLSWALAYFITLCVEAGVLALIAWLSWFWIPLAVLGAFIITSIIVLRCIKPS